jgi:flagellin
MTAARNLEETGRENAKSIARLSSGQRIVSAGDDAAGLAISQNLKAEVRGLQQAQRNAGDGISYAQTAEGSLNEVSNILVRLRELGVQASSDTLGDGERKLLDREFGQLKSEVDRISAVTTYNGSHLLDGSGSKLTFQVGTHAGSANSIEFDAGEANASASELGISGAGVSSRSDALDSLESVDKAINKVNTYRASLGALQDRLHSASNNLGAQIDNMTEAHSRIADTDVAEESANLARTSILQSAGIAVLAQANNSPAGAMKLL